MRQTRVGVATAGHGEVRRVPVALSDLRGGGELVVALRQLREGVVTRQRPRLSVQLHRREPLDERIAGTAAAAATSSSDANATAATAAAVEQPDAVVMRR